MNIPDLTNPRLWSVSYPDSSDRTLLDPIDGRPFNPDEVPRCIEEDALLSAGLRFLIARRWAIRMQTAYTRHVTEDDLSFGWRGRGFEESVSRANYFGFEAFGYGIEGPECYNRLKDSWRQREEPSKAQPIMNQGVNDITGFVNRRNRAIAMCALV